MDPEQRRIGVFNVLADSCVKMCLLCRSRYNGLVFPAFFEFYALLFSSLTPPNFHNDALQTREFPGAFIQARNATLGVIVETLLAHGILLKLLQEQQRRLHTGLAPCSPPL